MGPNRDQVLWHSVPGKNEEEIINGKNCALEHIGGTGIRVSDRQEGTIGSQNGAMSL